MISARTPLGLGSASPRRRALLEAVGLPLAVLPVEIDERPRGGEDPALYLERIVSDKLDRAAADARAAGTAVVLVADTVVLLGREILGKPASADEARSMLTRLSGRAHEVRTRFALGRPSAGEVPPPTRPSAPGGSAEHAETVSTVVDFRSLDPEEVARYVATGEGADKAGGYAIQGIGSFAVRRIEGSYANVVGLPVCEVLVALRRTGHLGLFP